MWPNAARTEVCKVLPWCHGRILQVCTAGKQNWKPAQLLPVGQPRAWFVWVAHPSRGEVKAAHGRWSLFELAGCKLDLKRVEGEWTNTVLGASRSGRWATSVGGVVGASSPTALTPACTTAHRLMAAACCPLLQHGQGLQACADQKPAVLMSLGRQVH